MNQKGIEIQTRDYERQRYSTDYTKDFLHQTVLPLSNCDICTH